MGLDNTHVGEILSQFLRADPYNTHHQYQGADSYFSDQFFPLNIGEKRVKHHTLAVNLHFLQL